MFWRARRRRLWIRRTRKRLDRQIAAAYKGSFKYEGLHGRANKLKWLPLGYVRYPEGLRTQVMALGDAAAYATMFDGKVVPCHDKG